MNKMLLKLEARRHRAMRRVPDWVLEIAGLLMLAWILFVIGCGLLLGYMPGVTQ